MFEISNETELKDYTIIKDEASLEKAFNDLQNNTEFVAFDTETNGLNVRTCKVIGFSWSSKIGSGFYYPIYTWDIATESLIRHSSFNESICKELLSALKTKQLIMHNASFDIRIVMNDLKVNLINSLHTDTILSEHTLNEEGPFGLKEIALK